MKWIKTKDRLPNKEGKVFVKTNLNYSFKTEGLWREYDELWFKEYVDEWLDESEEEIIDIYDIAYRIGRNVATKLEAKPNYSMDDVVDIVADIVAESEYINKQIEDARKN